MNEYNLELFADYFQFYLKDEQVPGDLSDQWTENAVKILLATAEGTIGVGTVRNMTVPVNIKIFETDPVLLSDKQNIFDQINECDIEVSSGKIVVAGCTDYFKEAKRIELLNGIYRARIYYGNLDKLSEDGLDDEDFYEIHLWKTNMKTNLTVLRAWSNA
jgi:hypothetical protein